MRVIEDTAISNTCGFSLTSGEKRNPPSSRLPLHRGRRQGGGKGVTALLRLQGAPPEDVPLPGRNARCPPAPCCGGQRAHSAQEGLDGDDSCGRPCTCDLTGGAPRCVLGSIIPPL